MATTTTSKKIPTVKLNIVEQLTNLIKSSAVLGIANAEGIGAKQIQRLRRLLEGDATLKVTKNTLMRLAVRNCKDEKADIAKLEEYLVGSNIFIFAKMDPFKLTRILDQNKMRTLAKPGHTAPEWPGRRPDSRPSASSLWRPGRRAWHSLDPRGTGPPPLRTHRLGPGKSRRPACSRSPSASPSSGRSSSRFGRSPSGGSLEPRFARRSRGRPRRLWPLAGR